MVKIQMLLSMPMPRAISPAFPKALPLIPLLNSTGWKQSVQQRNLWRTPRSQIITHIRTSSTASKGKPRRREGEKETRATNAPSLDHNGKPVDPMLAQALVKLLTSDPHRRHTQSLLFKIYDKDEKDSANLEAV